MKIIDFLQPKTVFLEMGPHTLKALNDTGGLELTLDRQENGMLTPECRGRLTQQLATFLKKDRWQRLNALCAISARGVALRRIQLPAAAKDDLDSLLRLQIERELPLPPEQLAWGYDPHPAPANPRGQGGPSGTDLAVVAVKRELIQEQLDLLSECGLNPRFTLGILTQSALCPGTLGSYALLDIGCTHSEWLGFEDGIPSGVRVIPWGGENLTRAIQNALQIGREEAEKLKIDFSQGNPIPQDRRSIIEQAVRSEVQSLAGLTQANGSSSKVYLTGKTARLKSFPASLADAMGSQVTCEPLPVPVQEGVSAATLAMQKASKREVDHHPLILHCEPAQTAAEQSGRAPLWTWAAIAAGLAVCSLFLRYAEPLFKEPKLSARLASLQSDWEALPNIDRELEFLKYFKDNQPPYLDAVTVVAGAAPRGMTVESLSMNRAGELSLQGTLRNSEQAVEFRSQLIKSGFFETVVVQEQTPAERNQVKVRIISRWKPSESRPPVPKEFLPPEPESNPESKADPEAANEKTTSHSPGPSGKPASSKPRPAARKLKG